MFQKYGNGESSECLHLGIAIEGWVIRAEPDKITIDLSNKERLKNGSMNKIPILSTGNVF